VDTDAHGHRSDKHGVLKLTFLQALEKSARALEVDSHTGVTIENIQSVSY
jgi:hypothetical protein